MDTSHFYLTFDHELLEDIFINEMNYIRTNWTFEGRPTMVFSVSSRLLQGSMDSVIGKLIKKFSTGHYMGIRAQLGTLTDFFCTSCITEWNFLNQNEVNDIFDHMCFVAQRRVITSSSVFQRSESKLESIFEDESGQNRSKLDSHIRQSSQITSMIGPSFSVDETVERKLFNFDSFKGKTFNTLEKNYQDQDTRQLLINLENTDDIFEQALCIFNLCRLEPLNFKVVLNSGVSYGTLRTLLRELYNLAGSHKLWLLLRHVSGYLKKAADGLSNAAANLLVRQKQFSVGYPNFREDVVANYLHTDDLKDLIYKCYQDDLTGAVLAQEVIIYLSMFIKTEGHLFDRMIRLRVGLIIEVAASEFARESKLQPDEFSEVFLNLSPNFMKCLIYHIISGKEFKLIKHSGEFIMVSSGSRLSKIKSTDSNVIFVTISRLRDLWTSLQKYLKKMLRMIESAFGIEDVFLTDL